MPRIRLPSPSSSLRSQPRIRCKPRLDLPTAKRLKNSILGTIEASLSQAGRDKIKDPTPGWSFKIQRVAEERTRVTIYKKETGENGKEVLRKIGSSATQARHVWRAYIAYNHFLFLDKWRVTWRPAREFLSHWGVCLRPADERTDETVHYVYGLNKLGFDSGSLILENIWGTNRGWKRELSDREVLKHSRYEEMEIYCSKAEFELQAQIFLEELTRSTGGRYNLFTMNCKHFAEGLYRHLKELEWDDKSRVGEAFKFSDMETRIMDSLLAHKFPKSRL